MKYFSWDPEKNEKLKTIIPSRKATKQYLKGVDENEKNDKGREGST